MNAIRPAKPSVKPPAPVPAASGVHRSLQINIDSEDDAKAVIQHLGQIKHAYDFGVVNFQLDSVEFCIAEDIRKDVDGMLLSAIRWCRTYVKQVRPFEGNVLFPLPHYQAPLERQSVVSVERRASERQSVESDPAPKRNRYLTPEVLAAQAQAQALGKSQPPVPADPATA